MAANVTLLQDALGTTNAAFEMQTVDGLHLAQLDWLMLDDDRALQGSLVSGLVAAQVGSPPVQAQ